MTGAQPGPDDRRDVAEALFEQALALPPAERAAFVEVAVQHDERLRTELTELLHHADAAERFFATLSDVVSSHAAQTTVAGRYEIRHCIGVGGMGAVYRARDTRLQRDVALKFLPLHFAAVPDGEARLLQEARAAAALEHVNVCTVYEIASGEAGRPFISMAFYDGETLKQRLARGPLPAAEAIQVARQLASALAAAHAHGVVHRDVKPGNVMLLPDRTVKLLDFGLAGLSDAALAQGGGVRGTVAYMSPEQARGEPVDFASDLFSLGVLAYEMVAGVNPFRGGDPQAVSNAILHLQPEPLRQHAPETPPALERIVMRLLEKQPAARFASATDLLDALEHAASAAGAHADAASGMRSRAVVALVLLLVLAGAIALWFAQPGPDGATRVTTSPADSTATATSPVRTIAVLPFANVNGDPEENYLVHGLTDELISALSKVGALRVVARTSGSAFQHAADSVREFGRTVGAGSVLTGSVQKAGTRIRVHAQLVSVADGLNLWSDTFDRETVDVFVLQRDLALRIAAALQAGLTPAERARVAQRPTASPEAFAFYLKGRHFYKQRTREGFLRAHDYYQRAIAADSQFAAAYAGLATVYSLQGIWSQLSPAIARERMRAAALRAVRLDDQSAEAHSVLGAYLHVYEWDSQQAEREQLRAIELDPGFVTARLFYGNLLRSHGRYEDALAQYRAGIALDPLDAIITEMIGRTLLLAGRPEAAREHFDNAIELDSLFWWSRAGLGSYYESSGRWTEALHEFRRAEALNGNTRADIARVLARAGREREAREMIAALKSAADRTRLHDPDVATALYALGDLEGALAWLERSYQERHPQLRFIRGAVPFQTLEVEPRYLDLLRRIGVR